jgi:hypothetical protein
VRRARLGAAIALAVSVLALGCSKKEDVVVAAADRVQITAADIDRDPVALLPNGAIGVVHVDAPVMFQSAFGQRLAALAASRVPVPPGAGFEPTRDLGALFIGLYSMSGADFAGVATGNFHPDAIERAADGTTVTPLGAPLVKTTYAKRTLYVSRNVGFAVLTEHTVLFGNETGIRRALDRLSEGRAAHDVAKWMDDVLKTANAPLAGAFDFQGQAPVAAGVKSVAFLQGIKTARIVGNFQPPGINFAGTLTYPTPEAAQAGAASIEQSNQMLKQYSFFMTLAGIGNPIQQLQTQPNGNDTQFVVAVESRAVEWALGQLAAQMGSAPGPVQATTTPAPYLQQGNHP